MKAVQRATMNAVHPARCSTHEYEPRGGWRGNIDHGPRRETGESPVERSQVTRTTNERTIEVNQANRVKGVWAMNGAAVVDT
jgi:hypothetical protein